MNSKGHKITSIYMSGGQAKNRVLMQLFANYCGMPVVLPADHASAVVLGAAILGRFAAEADKTGDPERGKDHAETLWKIMVRSIHLCKFFI